MNIIEKEILRISQELIERQNNNGSWHFCFESGTMTDSYMLLLMKALQIDDPHLSNRLIKRIVRKQTEDGSWKLYADEQNGNVSATLECVLALLYSGAKNMDDPEIEKAYAFLQNHGGDQKASMLTKILLTLLGHRSWSDFPPFPVEMLLLPLAKKTNLFQFVGYARVHVVPILIMAQQQYHIKLPKYNEIDTWLQPLKNAITMESFQTELSTIHFSPTKALRRRSLQAGIEFMLERIEPDHTLYSYMTSTFFMIFALLSVHQTQYNQTIKLAYRGIKTFHFPLSSSTTHIQETTSTVWDTSLILYALQKAGLPAQHKTVYKGLHYLLGKQHVRQGDWARKNPHTPPGGWGFSNINTINPDNDDTIACLRALAPSVYIHPSYQVAWERGITWLLSMQNKDGGWSAFEKNTDPFYLKWITDHTLRKVLADPSTPDLTGRVLDFLGSTDCHPDHPQIQKACQWLFTHQQKDGSWYGRWGICFIYGTWTALTGLSAVKVKTSHPQVKKGLQWLLSIQNPDGGWGESCASDHNQSYIPLHKSNLVQTAWALDALVTHYSKPNAEILRGIRCLIQLLHNEKDSYPTGAGFPGQVYFYYHSYHYIWPLITLSRIREKYGNNISNFL